MADNGSEIARPAEPSADTTRARRSHTYSRLTTAIAVLALATAGYALMRLDSTRDRLDQVNDLARTLDAERNVLRAELKSLSSRERQSTRQLDHRLDALDEVPKQLQDLASSVEQLRGRAEGPERAWSRAEAMFLLELAQRRLALDRDVQTAIVALESADTRLAALRDASLTPVRAQIARELQGLRAVQQPDDTGILVRLASAEDRAMHVPIKGISPVERSAAERSALPSGMFARAWTMTSNTLSRLIVVRDVDDLGGRIVTAEEALLRRQHLQLLLFSARMAVARHDSAGYRQSLASARRWLGEYFDVASPAGQSLLAEVQSLEPVEVDPALPDLSASSQALRRLMPARRGPE
jgi:uroporphyrin-3 C-methyltransferase